MVKYFCDADVLQMLLCKYTSKSKSVRISASLKLSHMYMGIPAYDGFLGFSTGTPLHQKVFLSMAFIAGWAAKLNQIPADINDLRGNSNVTLFQQSCHVRAKYIGTSIFFQPKMNFLN